jgi:DNA-binding transcriptional regulator YhcF (GntR family)
LSRHILPVKVALDRRHPQPIFRQVAAAVSRAIAIGHLTRGMRMPSTRALAKTLGVSRNTILAAYAELTSDGLIESSSGSGTWVAAGVVTAPAIDWADVLRQSRYPSRLRRFSDPEGNAFFCYHAGFPTTGRSRFGRTAGSGAEGSR